ncbi:cytochrome P450 [Actinoplanes sp. NPDC048967]|uniref:cytochrome P450 n=1 Tax=Actinoplanes sp. NPDC048967 TaxID=3155269 RepID=UPI0033E20FD9
MTTVPAPLVRPPGPRGHRFFGNVVDYDKDRVAFLERCRREYGDVFSFDPRTVVIADPALIHDILSRTNDDFLAETVPLAVRTDEEETAAGAELWMSARRRGWRGLNRTVAEAHALRLRAIFDRSLRQAGPGDVDVLAVMKDYMGRAIADFCVSRDAEGLPAVIAENTAALDPLSRSSYMVPQWWPSRRVRRFVRAREATVAAMTEVVRRRRAAGPPAADTAPDLLDVLLAADAPALSDLQVERLIRGIMLAAYGVPAAALTWIVHDLVAHPEVRRAVEQEAAAHDTEVAPPTTALPYTEAFVKEVLRLRPPTWLIGRTARRATTLGEWRLDRGDQVLFSLYALHRDERWWRDPEAFDPRRWLEPRAQLQRHTYLPFGAGPRVCVGTQLGMIQLVLSTFWLVREYDVSIAPGHGGTPDFGGLLTPRGLTATFHRRTGQQ